MGNTMIDHGIYVMGAPSSNPSLAGVATPITAKAGLASHSPADTTAMTGAPAAPATGQPMGALQ
jgi:hypothetical protein